MPAPRRRSTIRQRRRAPFGELQRDARPLPATRTRPSAPSARRRRRRASESTKVTTSAPTSPSSSWDAAACDDSRRGRRARGGRRAGRPLRGSASPGKATRIGLQTAAAPQESRARGRVDGQWWVVEEQEPRTVDEPGTPGRMPPAHAARVGAPCRSAAPRSEQQEQLIGGERVCARESPYRGPYVQVLAPVA